MPSVNRPAQPRSDHEPDGPARLPLRWAVIAAIAAVAGVFAGVGGGPAAGILAFVAVAGGLHLIVG